MSSSKMSELLELVKSGKLSVDEASKQLESAAPSAVFTMKVSDKGAITFRGVPGSHHQFGLTMYAKGVEFLFANREKVEAFIKANRSNLSWEKKKAEKAA